MPYWFEWMKLAASFTTPIIVAIAGYYLNKRLKSIDDAQWQSRKIIEKRLAIFDEVAPELNKVFCFCHFLGYWKEISPLEMIKTKRSLDRSVNIYRHLLSEDFYIAYNAFIHTAFRTYTGHGKDALIRSQIENHWGDQRVHATYQWDASFDSMFDRDNLPSDVELEKNYLLSMHALRKCVGLADEGKAVSNP